MIDLPDGFEFSSDRDRMDRELIHTWLSQEAYWALDRPRETQDAAIDGSRNYGLFRATGEQVAYARAVTDSVTFAWVCDVFVQESQRGLGLGLALVSAMCADLDALGLKRIVLTTSTSHDLYRRFGFDVVEAPDRWMVKLPSTARSRLA